MKMTLVNSRNGKAAKGFKGYRASIKSNGLGYAKSVGLAGAGVGIGLIGSQLLADQFFGNDETKSAEENAKAKRTGQMITRGGMVGLGLLLTPFLPMIGVGIGISGVIGLGRSALGAMDSESKVVTFAQEGIERDYGNAIEAAIEQEAVYIANAVQGNQPQLAGLPNVQTSAVNTKEPTTIMA